MFKAFTLMIVLTMLYSTSGAGTLNSYSSKDTNFDIVVGTQTIGPAYQFTRQPRLLETAQEIYKMGSNIIKFSLDSQESEPVAQTLLEIVKRDGPTKAVLDMPFSYEILWAYNPSTRNHLFDPSTLSCEYKQMYDLTQYFLKAYDGTGKTFLLGNWETDWHLTDMGRKQPTQKDIGNLTAWVNTRQRAVDDAKRDTPHSGVQVFYYLEVNRVVEAQQGEERVANTILPQTNVDYVSYSAYDALSTNPEANLKKSLEYLEIQMQPKPGIKGKRIFVGEFGFPAANYGPEQQRDLSKRVIALCLEWGCPFVLYWEMYNNEVVNGQQKGFWIIDDRGVKQPIYYMLQEYYVRAHAFLDAFRQSEGRLPTQEEFGHRAKDWLR